MFLILTNDHERYTVESFQHKNNGIIFEYKEECVYLDHDNIKEISGYNPVNARGYSSRSR